MENLILERNNISWLHIINHIFKVLISLFYSFAFGGKGLDKNSTLSIIIINVLVVSWFSFELLDNIIYLPFSKYVMMVNVPSICVFFLTFAIFTPLYYSLEVLSPSFYFSLLTLFTPLSIALTRRIM